MSTVSTKSQETIKLNFESFIEWDNNPFILFSNEGKIIYLNHAAEILFGYASKEDLYHIALTYAPQNFGHKMTQLTLTYDTFIFFAISVGYENEEQLSLRLYHMPPSKPKLVPKTDNMVMTDINILLEANIALFRTKNTNTLRLLADQDLPPFKIDQNHFSKLLRKALDSFRASDSIDITLKLLIGQHILIDAKKTAIVHLSIKANGRYNDADTLIESLATEAHIKCITTEYAIILEIPFIRNDE